MRTTATAGLLLGLVLPVPAAQGQGADGPARAIELLRLAETHYSGSNGQIDESRAHALFQKASELGDSVARLRVASLYHLGRAGFPQDAGLAREMALESFESALARALAGEAAAQFAVGSAYLLGLGRTADTERALAWYERAAPSQPWAAFNLGWMCQTGVGVDRDLVAAYAWFGKAAEAGYARALYEVGVARFLGRGTHRDVEAGAAQLRDAAGRGYQRARFYLAYISLSGGIEPREADAAVAAPWLADTILSGTRGALDDVLQLDQEGFLPPSVRREIVTILENGVAAGDPHAMEALGVILADGRFGLPSDSDRSFELGKTAAEAGLPVAMQALAFSYWNGQGTPRDRAAAIEWWTRAADRGHALSQYRLGIRYLGGDGVGKDSAGGLRLLGLAAAQGHWASVTQLARIYDYGWYDVPIDRAEAERWYRRGAAMGIAEAIGWVRAEEALR